ncbi:MAG TPA: TMEM175 family protein [Nitrososphaerales archaeon]|nr:TMEM175 family protein [Nitrososphaerales archaeon]
MSSEVHHVLPGLGKERLESLTDGIFGTVMTVLVLSLSVPIVTSNANLIEDLNPLYPNILSYIISFAILGTFWIRHHSMFHYVIRVDRILLWLNISFLMTIGFIPFSTALIGRYPFFQTPLIIYGANLIATNVTSQFLWFYSSKRKLLSSDLIDEKIMSKINRRITFGPLAYVAGIAVSFYSTGITLLIYVVTLVFLIFTSTVGYRVRHRGEVRT